MQEKLDDDHGDSNGETVANSMGDSHIPTVKLGDLVVYDAFAMRSIRHNGIKLAQRYAGTIAYNSFGDHLSGEGLPFQHSVIQSVGRAVWPLFVKSPAAPTIEYSGFVNSVWRYILVPSALVGAAVCLDYWSDRNLRGLHWNDVGGRATNFGAGNPQVHAEEYLRSKQVLFESLGQTEGTKYANDLASTKPTKWIKQLRKRDAMTARTVNEMGMNYESLLRPPLTIKGEKRTLTNWLIDKHVRHPSGQYLPRQLEPDVSDYGGACACTYALMLSLLYNDTAGRIRYSATSVRFAFVASLIQFEA